MTHPRNFTGPIPTNPDFAQGNTIPPGLEGFSGLELGPGENLLVRGADRIRDFLGLRGDILTLNDQVSKGDIIRATFTVGIPFFKESQKNLLVAAINRDKRFSVTDARFEQDRLILIIRIIESPVAVGIIVGSIIATGFAIFLFLNLESVERLVKSSTPVFVSVAVVALVVLVLQLFRK